MQWNHGKQAEFKAVYDAVYPIIIRIVYKITVNLEVAEELCQEAFIRYYQKMERIPDADQAKYWLIRVSKNLALNHAKRKGREQKAYERVFWEPKPREDSGEISVLKQESYKAVQEALQRLPENLRVVLILKEYGELSYREIGSVLGISEGNVKVRAYRARERLADNLKDGDVYVP